MAEPWVIYVLLDPVSGKPCYVGVTNNLKRRLKEHKRIFGHKPQARVIDAGSGPRAKIEDHWIEYHRSLGLILRNKTQGGGGRQTHTISARAKISAANKGKRVARETREKIRAALSGMPHNWSDEGRRSAARTQFQVGHARFAALSDDQKATHSARSKERWDGVSLEERSRRATARNVKAWAAMSSEQRALRGRRISQGQRAAYGSTGRSEICRLGGLALAKKDPEAAGRRVKDWWKSLSPEAKADFLRRRAVKIAAAKAAKRATAQGMPHI